MAGPVRSILAVACVLAFGATCACGGARVAPKDAVDVTIRLDTETFVLPNGLTVLLHREPSAGAAYVHVRYDVGSKDDPRGRAGLAHLFEHLMFRAPKHGAERDFHAWLDEIGADFNATTGHDVTTYFELVPASELPRALWLEADRMAYPLATLDEASFGHERDVVKNEGRERADEDVARDAWAVAYREVFGADHPYAVPPIGRPEQLDAITLDDARAFARTYYRPNNATLVVCGAFDKGVARALVTKYFATIPPGAPLPVRVFRAPTLRAPRAVAVAADVPAPVVVYAWPSPPVHGDGWEALHYGLGFVSGYAAHRLVAKEKIADDVEGDIVDGRLGSLAVITVRLKPGASVDAVTAAVDDNLAVAAGLDRYPLERFGDEKTRMMVERIGRLEHLDGRAAALLHGVDHHGAPDAMQDDLRRWQAVSMRDVATAVRQILAEAPRVMVVMTPGGARAARSAP